MRFSGFIIAILVAAQIFPLRAGYSVPRKTTVVIVPLYDGDGDSVTEGLIDSLHKNLRENSSVSVIRDENVASVLQYYDAGPRDGLIDKIEDLLTRAKESYYRLGYIEANSLAESAISLFNSSQKAPFSHGDILLDAYLTLGLIFKSFGNVGEARSAFEKAIRLNPEYKLDNRAFSPTIIGMFEEIKRGQKLVPTGRLKVSSDPKVSDVYIDGIKKGVTPFTLDALAEGEHYLMVAANNYSSVQKKINIRPGKVTKISETLEWTVDRGQGPSGKKFVTGIDPAGLVDEGVRIGGLLKVDKVAIVDYDLSGKTVVTERVVDVRYRSGQRPISLRLKGAAPTANELGKLSNFLLGETLLNIASNPEKYTEPFGKGDVALVAGKKKPRVSRPVLLGILGGILAACLGGGLAAAFSGGGSSNQAGTGDINVQFR